jgi:hypothetical protein
MISVASGFQYSVNISYDLYDDNKLKNFIPTTSSLLLLENILLSTNPNATNRARILIGAYGKGKSHIVLMILSILMKRDFALFDKLIDKLENIPKLKQLVENYYESDNKILPIIITGANTSLSQAFLLSLQRTLSENDLLDVMPETNYHAAIATIERWKNDFPETLLKFEELSDCKHEVFIDSLIDFDINSYRIFEELYPELTAGSTFNPFVGFDVVELYESVAKELRGKGYTGIYVVYDEFSKYLEANIQTASVSDTKMLQDFAEKCTRSGSLQLHLMLISHKEIANYIDKLPKQKVDGWRGISERFEHIQLNNNFSQTYEIIRTVIQHDEDKWRKFYKQNESILNDLYKTYTTHPIFSDIDADEAKTTIESCYPLHPISTFILPRLSERIAQNERTLFTFLSAKGDRTLSSFLDKYREEQFKFLTPDRIYDYFEPLFRKEIYLGALYDNYILTKKILEKIKGNDLETKIIKTISLIYSLEQFERLEPSSSEIINIFSLEFTNEEVSKAIDNLIEKECVVYIRRSNGFLKLKESSGVNIREKISEVIEKERNRITVKDILNENNYDSYLYPSRYNSDKDMTRYFSFYFIDSTEITADVDWYLKAKSLDIYDSDGFVFAIIPNSQDEISRVKNILQNSTINSELCVFILPKEFYLDNDLIYEFNAVSILKAESVEDEVLFEEYEVIYEDLLDVVNGYISNYTRPENGKSIYIHNSYRLDINRRAELSEKLSKICDETYSKTPIVNNEVINRNELTTITSNSRNKIITALLRSELDINLGLTGSGQEVSIMRSTLVRTGILEIDSYPVELNLDVPDDNMRHMLLGIVKFVFEAKRKGKINIGEIYDYLLLPKYSIGLRRGLIPIYLSAVFSRYSQEIIIKNKIGQLPLNADTMEQINANPDLFTLHYLEWDEAKEIFIEKMEKLFEEFVIKSEKLLNSYNYVVLAMKRWYLSLPKFTKESKRTIDGEKVDKRYLSLLKALRSDLAGSDLLFEYLPKEYDYSEFSVGICENIEKAKSYFDNFLNETKKILLEYVRNAFSTEKNQNTSTSSIIKDWLDTLDDSIYSQIFSDRTDKCLTIFKNITADDDSFIERLSKLATGLRIEDWEKDTFSHFKNNLEKYKHTAETYIGNRNKDSDMGDIRTNQYQISYMNNEGNVRVRRFDKIERSKRSDLLFNAIEAQIFSMGHALTEDEKRQVLIEILSKLI